MPRTRFRYLQLVRALLVAGALGTLSGCGGGGDEDLAMGKQLFTQRCGSCHVLSDAQTRGVIGPDLDDSFAQAIADGLGRDTVEGVVREQIAFPQGGQMPANLVEGKDADAVAAYVASVAGKRGRGAPPAGGDGEGKSTKANSRGELEIPADPTGQLAYEFTEATAKPGRVTLLSKNDSTVPHNIAIKDGGVEEEGPVVSGGKTSKVAAELKSGRYTFYCSVPGHEQGGMKGTLTVR